MGQAALCQGEVGTVADSIIEVPGAHGTVSQACSCLPSKCGGKSATLRGDRKHKDRNHHIGADDYDTDDSSGIPSDPEDENGNGHVVLMRHRVFSPHLQTKFHDCYKIVKLLGEGSFGNVYEATMIAPGQNVGRHVAAKCFSLHQQVEGSNQVAQRCQTEIMNLKRSFERERSILSRLEHPHLVRMYECFEDKGNLWIVLELCRGGELYECIADKVRNGPGGGLDEKRGRVFFRQMLYATSYLHSCNVVHRDVKTENFLLLGEPGTPHGDIIKLCDFGTAVVLSPQQPRAMEKIGTLSYTAPEVYARKGATVRADAWSLGVVLYVLLVGASPFRVTGEEPREATVNRIQAGDYDKTREAWSSLTKEAKDLIRRLLVVDEAQRMTSDEALRHPWAEINHSGVLVPATRELKPVRSSPRGPAPLLRRDPKEPDVILDPEGAKALLRLFWRFARLDPLQQLLLVVCAQMTSEDEVMRCRDPVPWYDLFFALDENEDGRLNFDEFTRGMKLVLDRPGAIVPVQTLDWLARSLDLDCSGTVEWVEWVAVWILSQQHLHTEQEPLRTAFRLLDRPSGDGNIGAADLLAVVSVGAGIGLSTKHGREFAHNILGKWVAPGSPDDSSESLAKRTKSKGRRSSSATSAPSLGFSDVRRALQAVLSQTFDEETEPSIYTPRGPAGDGSMSLGLFHCCMTNQASHLHNAQVHINVQSAFQGPGD